MAFIETILEDAAEGATAELATVAAYRALDPELRAALTVGRPIEGG
jgi:hypothetical protein